MSLQFIYGNAGSGKSSYVFKKTVDEAQQNLRKNYYVVVPEQFTMQTQRELVELQREHAIMNVDVVSFQRLAYRVFDELGMTEMAVLEETGKSLVLRKVAQEKEAELHVLQANMKKMGYISEVKSLISELTQYNIEPEDLKEFLEENSMSPAFTYKMQDVLMMYQGFREYIKDTYITSEEVLEVFRNTAHESGLIRESVLIFDGFTGFTPIQNNLIQTLMGLVDRIYVTVTLDALEDPYSYRDMQELFAMSKKTVKTLIQMAEQAHMEVETPVILTDEQADRFAKAPQIRFLSQNLFRTNRNCMNAEEENDIYVRSLPNPREELKYVAAKIAGLVREKGYRYRDIAVISGAVMEYGNYVPQIFAQYEIPYFLDTTKNILLHPFIEFVRAMLQAVNENFSYEAVFRFLRCGFCNVTEEETDRLENYVLAMGIRGIRKWDTRFALLSAGMTEAELEQMNDVRSRVMECFRPLQNIIKQKDATVREITVALYHVIASLQVEQQLKVKENQYQLEHNLSKAKEYAQIYRIVMDLLDKMVTVLGNEVMKLDEYGKILDSGFETAKVGVIPSGYDRVLFGDIERSRLDRIKVLFLVSVNDGIVPKTEDRGGIISQLEREEMARCSLELAPTAREKIFIQRFYLYLAVSKPSEKLFLTYARAGSDGTAQRPSYLIHQMKQMFPGMKTVYADAESVNDELVTPRNSLAFLLEGLTPENGWTEEQERKWRALVHWYQKNPDYEKKLADILSAAATRYREESIGRAAAKALYGEVLKSSVTRLEQYAACACAHFLTYGLGLKERQLFEFKVTDMGNIYHQALENYAKSLRDSAYTWFDIQEHEQENFIEQAMADAIAGEGNAALADTAQNRYQVERMMKIFRRTIWALTGQIRQGKFEPEDFEVSFAFTDELNAVNFQLSDDEKMKLRGRIDRIDTYETKDKLYVKIIDYKSGNTSFELLSLYHGLKLQLVVYMNAAQELLAKKNPSKEIHPAGMFYYHIDDPVIEGKGTESETEIYQKIFEKLRLDGVVSADEESYRALDTQIAGKSSVIPLSLNKDGTVKNNGYAVEEEQFRLISDYASHMIRTAGESIYEGDTAVRPYQLKDKCSCDYCAYASICGYDTKIEGYRMRKLKELSPEEILERMKEAEEK